MNKEKRKDAIKDINRQAIIDACEALMMQKTLGFAEVTMDEIAHQAEFTKRTVYQYFQSKEELQFAIMINGYQKMIHRMTSIIHAKQTGLDQVQALGQSLRQYSIEDPKHFWLIMDYQNADTDFHVQPSLIEETYRLGEQAIGYLVEAIQKGQRDGSIIPDLNRMETALTVWSFLLGLLRTRRDKFAYMQQMHQIDVESWMDRSMHVLLQSISTKGVSST